jgi:hypothetical protein
MRLLLAGRIRNSPVFLGRRSVKFLPNTKYVCIMAHYAKDYKARTAPSL